MLSSEESVSEAKQPRWRILRISSWSWWIYGLVAAGTVLHAYTASQSYFYVDDFVYFSRVTDTGFWAAVAPPYGEHLMPFQFAAVWLTQQFSAMSWAVAVIVMTVLWFTFLLGAAKALCEVFGERFILLVPLALLAFAPLLTVVTIWYASALQALSWGSCFVWFLYFSHRYVYGAGTRRNAVLAILVLVAGLLTWQKALSVVPVVVLLLLVAGPISLANVALLWRRCRAFVVAVVGITLGYLCLYLAMAGTGQLQKAPSTHDLLESARRMIFTGLVPSLFGLDSSSPVVTGTADEALDFRIVALCLMVALLVVVVTVYRRPATAWIWIMLAGYSAVAVIFFAYARLEPFGPILASDGRYIEDLFIASVFGLTFAWLRPSSAPAPVREIRGLESLRKRSALPVLGGVAAAVMVLGSLSLTASWAKTRTLTQTEYINNARDHLWRAGNNGVLDYFAPGEVLDATHFGETARQSVVLKGLKIPVNWDGPGPGMGMLDDKGVLAPVQLGIASSSEAGPIGGCGWVVRSEPTSVLLDSELFVWDWVVQIQYLSEAAGLASIGFSTPGSSTVTLPIEKGLNDVWLELTGGGDALTIQSLTDTGICVDKVTLGEPE